MKRDERALSPTSVTAMEEETTNRREVKRVRKVVKRAQVVWKV